MKVFLVGFMGSGKSYWAAKIAEQLQVSKTELDEEVEKASGLTINKIFDEKGEAWFREKETAILKQFAAVNDFLLSSGGGTACFFENMNWMNEQGVTVWFNTSEDKMVKQLLPEIHKRPLLKGMNEKEVTLFVKEKLKERIHFYQQADISISADEFDLDTLKRNIELIHQLKFGK